MTDELKYVYQVLRKGQLYRYRQKPCAQYSETRKIHGLRFADLLNLLCYDDRNHLTNFLMYQDTALPRGNLVPPQQSLAAE